MENLATYRLNSLSEIDAVIAKIGAEKFSAYKKSVYDTLRKLKPGDKFEIAGFVKQSSRKSFIKTACLYMIETAGNCNIILADDYTHIRGVLSFNEELKQQQEYNRLHPKIKRK